MTLSVVKISNIYQINWFWYIEYLIAKVVWLNAQSILWAIQSLYRFLAILSNHYTFATVCIYKHGFGIKLQVYNPNYLDYIDNISYPLFVHVIRKDIYGGVPYHMRPEVVSHEASCDTAPHHRYLPYCVEQTGDNKFII